ncbi:MAG TPA: hypothetical protein DCM38_06890 [Gammaproteobacteria bacterium]|nr:hypothetical protein [Gammaproteobacteria bacterium]
MNVKITDNGLLIEDLLINDPETVKYYQQQENLVDEVSLAIKIGTIMLEKANVVAQSDYLEKRITEIVVEVEKQTNNLMQSLEANIRKTFDPDETDSAMMTIKQIFDTHLEPLRLMQKSIQEKQGELEKSFNPDNNDGYAGKIVKTFQELETRFNAMFDPEQKTSFPSWLETQFGDLIGKKIAKQMTDIQDSIRHELQQIREDLIVKQAVAKSKSFQIGEDFQERVYEQLQEIARVQGDVVSDTSTIIGEIHGSKKGDIAYDFQGDIKQRIFFECKNVKKTETFKEVSEYMKEAMENRKANFGIYLVESEEKLHKQFTPWQVYYEQRFIATSFNLLEMSLRVAKLLVGITNSNALESIDASAIKIQLDNLNEEVKRSKSVKTKLNVIKKYVNELQTLDDERCEHIKEAIIAITNELSKAYSLTSA